MGLLRSGLFRRFALVLGVLALAPVALLDVQLISISHRGIQAAVLELHTKLAEKLAAQIDLALQTTDEKLKFALAPLKRQMELTDKQALLRSLVENDSAIDEERRLCYVGVTRAREYLTLSFALTRRKWGKPQKTIPSRFLYEMTGQAENFPPAEETPKKPKSRRPVRKTARR